MNASFDKVGVVNKALYKIGAKRIASLSENSSNATIMSDIYPQCLQSVLEEHPWSFATNTVALTTLTATLPTFGDGISIAYALPSDFLSLYLVNQAGVQYRIEMLRSPVVTSDTMAFCSDTPGLIIKYTFFNDDPTSYSAKFYDALSCKLAYEACFKISEAATLAAAKAAEYDKALLSAMASDSKNSIPDQPIANEWFVARVAGSGVVSGLPNGNIGFFPNPFNPDF